MTTEITSYRGQAMMSYMPRYYESSRVIRSLIQVEGAEVDSYRLAIEDILNQFFVRTATWSLDSWESELNVPLSQNQTDTERQDKIVSRLRGTGTATIRVVKEVAESYDGGNIDVIENAPEYEVTIRFVDTQGIPSNLDDLKSAVRAVMPAHLAIIYEFSYLNFDELDGLNLTFDELDALNLTFDELDVLL